jgi:hypothetical protein
MPEIVTFGSVFLYSGKEYVYLDRSEDVVYAAEILNKEFSNRLKKICANAAINSKKSYSVSQNQMYCFVELQTKEYMQRVAHYGFSPALNAEGGILSDVIGRLCTEDIKELYTEISKDDLAVSLDLKERIKKISLN